MCLLRTCTSGSLLPSSRRISLVAADAQANTRFGHCSQSSAGLLSSFSPTDIRAPDTTAPLFVKPTECVHLGKVRLAAQQAWCKSGEIGLGTSRYFRSRAGAGRISAGYVGRLVKAHATSGVLLLRLRDALLDTDQVSSGRSIVGKGCRVAAKAVLVDSGNAQANTMIVCSRTSSVNCEGRLHHIN